MPLDSASYLDHSPFAVSAIVFGFRLRAGKKRAIGATTSFNRNLAEKRESSVDNASSHPPLCRNAPLRSSLTASVAVIDYEPECTVGRGRNDRAVGPGDLGSVCVCVVGPPDD